jgi:hypothetical protein
MDIKSKRVDRFKTKPVGTRNLSRKGEIWKTPAVAKAMAGQAKN